MAELSFISKLTWSGGRHGPGVVETGGQSLQFSVPASMGGVGVGTSPEDLLLSAVGSCYTATLAAILDSRGLSVQSFEVVVQGLVSQYPGPAAALSSIVVNPRFIGIESGREKECESAAMTARERCFIGKHLGPQVSYRVGEVEFAEETPSAGDVLDVRALPAPRRHELIFRKLDELVGRAAITLVNDHDPKPLHYQLEATRPGDFSWDYVERGPEAWRVRIARIT
jgi:peroxiredoxin-like protein